MGMTDPDASRDYLSRALRRMRLPIAMKAWDRYDIDGVPVCEPLWLIRTPTRIDTYCFDAEAACATYLSLCAELDPTAS